MMIEHGMILEDERERKPDAVCDECGEPLWFDDCAYMFNDEIICEECVKRHKFIVMPR